MMMPGDTGYLRGPAGWERLPVWSTTALVSAGSPYADVMVDAGELCLVVGMGESAQYGMLFVSCRGKFLWVYTDWVHEK